MTTAPTVSPEAFLADPAHAVGEESDPFTELERRVCALEDLLAGGQAPSSETVDAEALSWMPQEISDLQGVVLAKTVELQDLEAKHLTLLAVVDEIGRIVKKSTSKVSLEVKAAIDAWANPQTPSPAAEPPHSEPQPEPIPAASTEAIAGEGLPPMRRVDGVPTHDAPVEEWRSYARAAHGVGEGTVIDTMNRSQIRTMLGIEQPVAQS